MRSVAKVYVKFEKLVPALFFVSIFVVMLFEIFSRGIFKKSFAWNTEYCRFALVWVTFLGCIYVRREGLHIKVQALYDFFDRRGNKSVVFLMDLLVSILALAFWALLAYYGGMLSYRVRRIISPALEISLFWLYLPTCVCGILSGVTEMVGLVMLLLGKRQPGQPILAEAESKEVI